MNVEEMGRVHAFLLGHRMVETKPVGRRIREHERDIAAILAHADPEELSSFYAFLGAQGFTLVAHDDTSMPGVPTGGRVWLLVRSARENPPSYLTTERIHAGLKRRATDTHQATTIWFLHIWLNCLALLYTLPGRGVSEVSRFHEISFKRQMLEDAVRQHIEQIRRTGIEGGAAAQVVETLVSETGRDIPRRIGNFLNLMCESGLLQESDSDEYRQTLLGAIEIAQSFNHALATLHPGDDKLDNVVNIVDPRSSAATSPQASPEE